MLNYQRVTSFMRKPIFLNITFKNPWQEVQQSNQNPLRYQWIPTVSHRQCPGWHAWRATEPGHSKAPVAAAAATWSIQQGKHDAKHELLAEIHQQSSNIWTFKIIPSPYDDVFPRVFFSANDDMSWRGPAWTYRPIHNNSTCHCSILKNLSCQFPTPVATLRQELARFSQAGTLGDRSVAKTQLMQRFSSNPTTPSLSGAMYRVRGHVPSICSFNERRFWGPHSGNGIGKGISPHKNTNFPAASQKCRPS